MLSADVSASTYLLPATEGLTAGATADSPTGDGTRRARREPGAERTRDHHDRSDLWSHPMSVLNDTWRFLVQRRLWPVAILLIAAAVAVPMLLSEEPAAAAGRAGGRRQGRQAGRCSPPSRSWPRRPTATAAAAASVLGSRKDPFKPQATPTPTPKPETAATADTGRPTAGTTEPGAPTAASVGGSPAPDVDHPGRCRTPKKKTTSSTS